MTATNELLRCRCGMGMMPTQGVSEGYYCPNCDQCQAQETKFERRLTPQDIKYNNYWDNVIRDEYVDHTEPEPEVGTPNSEDGGDTPSEPEGETP